MKLQLKRMFRTSVLFCMMVLVMTVGFIQPVHAAEPEEAESIGTSLYDVSTALTAYANNVVGANANDKHNDHKLSDFSGAGSVGKAGAFLGYGDAKKGFYGSIASSNSKSVTTTSYDAWLNVGDGGASYAYARYGYLLNDLGLDDTALEGDNGGRFAFGILMQGINAICGNLNKLFSGCLSLLQTLNPFGFFISNSHVTNITDYASNVDKLPALLQGVADGVSEFYNWLQDFGVLIVIPTLIVMWLWVLLLTQERGKGRKGFTVVIRLTFIVIGVPILAFLYTATLDNMFTMTSKEPPSPKMVATTFVDFESWVKTSRLGVPTNAHLVSAGTENDANKSGAVSGVASNESFRTVRQTAKAINQQSGIVDSSLFGNMGDVNGTYGGLIWNTDSIISAGKDAMDFDEKSKNALRVTDDMLGSYRGGDRYQASAWDTAVNGAFRTYYSDSEIGNVDSTGNAASNSGKIYEMYGSTDTSGEWMNREKADNAAIFSGSAYPNGGKWAGQRFNIFDNGSLTVRDTISKEDILSYSGGANKADAANPNTMGGLSTVSMYNYLSSSFTPSDVQVFSAVNSSSNYVKESHFSVNLIGTGFARMAFGVNCIAVVGVITILGVVYGIGMCISNLKRGMSLLFSIPGAMLGFLHSIVQVIMYVFAMIMELVTTIFLYSFMAELLISFAQVIEKPINEAFGGGTLAFIRGIPADMLVSNRGLFAIGICVIALCIGLYGHVMVKNRRGLLCAYELLWCHVYRRITCKQMQPVFDAWMANRKSLYAWDFSTHRKRSIWKDVWSGVMNTPAYQLQKGGVR